ncbi:MAG: BTAD domain-containing putative transcriptional regulator, partial [Gemmatimonadota bacterium]
MTEFLAFGSLGLRDPTGRPVERVLAQPKRTALLAYLAFARPRGLHRRDELLAVFWPENGTGSARNALSRSLSFLRRELPEGLIVTRGTEEIGLDQDAVHSDVVAFEDAIARGDHRKAVALYRGPFLNALHVAGAPEFERWADNERERLREQASQSAWAAAHDDIGAGRFVEAERLGQRALAWSPTDESAARDFIAALAPGDRAAALRFYDKLAAVLAEVLEVAPAPETVALVESVRARDAAAPLPDTAVAAERRAEPVVAAQ